jgi:HAD superfamily phosphatase (TIGR01668 family)
MKLTNFEPDLYATTIYELNYDQLKDAGITAYLFDLDNTLVKANHEVRPPELLQLLRDLEAKGIDFLILSNNSHKRVAAFAEPLDILYVPRAAKPFAYSYRKALAMLGTKPEETAMVGDQRVTDIQGGNRAGLFTILVEPISESESVPTKINRFFEQFIIKKLKKHGIYKREEKR